MRVPLLNRLSAQFVGVSLGCLGLGGRAVSLSLEDIGLFMLTVGLLGDLPHHLLVADALAGRYCALATHGGFLPRRARQLINKTARDRGVVARGAAGHWRSTMSE